MRFVVLTATNMNIAVFGVVAPCSMIHIPNVSHVFSASIIRTISLDLGILGFNVVWYVR